MADNEDNETPGYFLQPPARSENGRGSVDSSGFVHKSQAGEPFPQTGGAYQFLYLDLILYDEYIHAMEKAIKRLTVLLDGPRFVAQFRAFLKTEHRQGPLFRAQKNGRCSTLSYQSVQQRWQRCCEMVGVSCAVHQLRHTHATALVNDGVSLATIRGRLGRKNLQMTLRSEVQSDETAVSDLLAR